MEKTAMFVIVHTATYCNTLQQTAKHCNVDIRKEEEDSMTK